MDVEERPRYDMSFKYFLEMPLKKMLSIRALWPNSGKDSNGENIKIAAKLNPSITQAFRKDEGKLVIIKMSVCLCPAGHLALEKHSMGEKEDATNQVDTYYFDVEKCKVCPLQDNCYRPGARLKAIRYL